MTAELHVFFAGDFFEVFQAQPISEFGGELFAKRYGKGGVAGGFQLGEESFDAGDGVWGDGLVRVE